MNDLGLVVGERCKRIKNTLDSLWILLSQLISEHGERKLSNCNFGRKEHDRLDGHAKRRINSGEKLHCQQGMAAKLKKSVVNSNLLDSKKF